MPSDGHDFFDHPIFDPTRFKLSTRGEGNLLQQLQQKVWTGHCGCFIYGGPRIGKTMACEGISKRFKTRTGQLIPSLTVSIPERDQHTIRAVHFANLQATNIKFRPRATSDQLAATFVNHLADLAVLNDNRCVLLFVDEMQRLRANQLKAYSELYDALRLVKLRLCVFFIANQSESKDLISEIDSDNYESIHGRFFVERIAFKGIHRLSDVRYILEQYDTTLFPTKHGISYTEYFVPSAYKGGFRLSDMSDLLWDLFVEHYKDRLKLTSWPAQYFFASINLLLPDYLHKYSVDGFEPEMFVACMEATGLEHSPIC